MMNSLPKTLGMPCAGGSVLRKGASSVPLPRIAGFLGTVPHSGLGPVVTRPAGQFQTGGHT